MLSLTDLLICDCERCCNQTTAIPVNTTQYLRDVDKNVKRGTMRFYEYY